MAIFRKIHTLIWSDTWFSELDKDKKLFYLYILTNERTRQCGIYEISKRQISFDLGYSIDTVSKLLVYFIKCKKIRYNEQTNEIAIGNWIKYNDSTSPKVKSCINKELKDVKDTLLIEYIYSIDTHSQQEQEQEQEEKEDIIDFDFKRSLLALGIDKQIVSDWLAVRKTKKATNTQTAFETIKKQIENSGMTPNECIKISVQNSWAGFNKEWIKGVIKPEVKSNQTFLPR